MLTTEQMVALCGAHLIKELADLRSFLPSFTEKDTNREGMALPCENPEGNHVQQIRMMTLSSHERYSHEEVEEVIEEMKPSLFRQMPQVASTGKSLTLPVTKKPHAYEKNTLHLPNTLREAPWKASQRAVLAT